MSGFFQLDFEQDAVAIERQLSDARRSLAKLEAEAELPAPNGSSASAIPGLAPAPEETPDQLRARIDELSAQRDSALEKAYADLDPWNTVRVARHPERPHARDLINLIFRDFCELHGDRRYGDDPAIITGFGRVGSMKCLVVGQEKGRSTQEKLACHFGCAHPEGYRKALAKMQLAEKYGLPIVTLVDTPGAYPGLGAEERGQAEAIAVNLREMSQLRTPIVSIVIGEGGSGGALGLAVADRVAMLSHAWYSVISPEGCAAILWKQANETTNRQAADALHLTASNNLNLGIIDTIVPEPLGGAHRDHALTARNIERWVTSELAELTRLDANTLVDARYARFRKLGQFDETPAGA